MGVDRLIAGSLPPVMEWGYETVAHFTVLGEPTSKRRHRTTTKDGETVSYTPAATKAAEEVIQAAYINGYRNPR